LTRINWIAFVPIPSASTTCRTVVLASSSKENGCPGFSDGRSFYEEGWSLTSTRIGLLIPALMLARVRLLQKSHVVGKNATPIARLHRPRQSQVLAIEEDVVPNLLEWNPDSLRDPADRSYRLSP
jgi:hypothetical protein